MTSGVRREHMWFFKSGQNDVKMVVVRGLMVHWMNFQRGHEISGIVKVLRF